MRKVVKVKDREPKKQEYHLCGDCANLTPIDKFTTLTVHGRRPTLGTCPYWTQSRCTLLSWRSTCEHFKPKQ